MIGIAENDATAAPTGLERFGFAMNAGGPHLARSMMLSDLVTLLSDNRLEQSRSKLLDAIEDENVLGKRTTRSRKLAARHMGALYGLDLDVPLYRDFVYLWQRDPDGRPLLAFLVAYARDAVLRTNTQFVLGLKENAPFIREELEAFIDAQDPGRFSAATLKSTAQNLATTWTHAGHLKGRVKKVRQRVRPTPGAVSLALLLGFVTGDRGPLLFESSYMKLLDCSPAAGMELAELAAVKGWIQFKRVGNVVEVLFPRLLTEQEREWVTTRQDRIIDLHGQVPRRGRYHSRSRDRLPRQASRTKEA
ncbi:hypothetical protein [Rhodopirellula europaea]|uniref:Uncharacterized protein n=1 Tax=Rhodopirellula europaea 6C TaxID=1263867 RepID=M2ACY0_9BACT|nr:hypothetical protein [Rhodopirellula europaea]EMB14845.1 hypothetical protein RE6C_04413 [Rhodopirellula europaea 6C]